MYYGVAQLISEARAVKEPVETVRVFPTDDPS
jgi:hypothetical protein